MLASSGQIGVASSFSMRIEIHSQNHKKPQYERAPERMQQYSISLSLSLSLSHSVVALHSSFCNLVNNLQDTGTKHTSIAFVGHLVLRPHVSPMVKTSVGVGIWFLFLFTLF